MQNTSLESVAERPLEVQCGHCRDKLPLRLSRQGERGAVWLCAGCSIPFVSLCIKDRLSHNPTAVILDERYFDTDGLPPISDKIRCEVARMAERAEAKIAENERRSERISQSLVVPAIKLNTELNPFGRTFQLMVANLSREGIGLIHNTAIEAEYIAVKLTLNDRPPIQVVVRLVRERELKNPLREFGGEFFVRLGSAAVGD